MVVRTILHCLLAERVGHTEVGLALAAAADRQSAIAGCEMLDDATGGALSTEAAREYAAGNGLVFVEAAGLVAALG